MTEIGSVLKKRKGDGPAQIRVVGARDGLYIAQDLNFGPSFELNANELRVQYGGDGEPPAEVN